MATIRTKLKQLRNADVRFISLVDRAATRIPFRVLKRENEMGIDLMKVFKSGDPVKPYVSALVVLAQKDETVTAAIREAIQKHGFATDRVQKSDEGETLLYAQGDQPSEVQVVRLGDQVLASVAGLTVPEGWVGDLVEEHGFFPDLKMATAALYDQVMLVAKSETPQADAKEMMTSFGQYLDQMLILPAACFKLDEVISEIVQKAEPKTEEKKPTEPVEKAETEEERKKRIAEHPPSEMAPPDEEDDQKPPPEAVKTETVETETPVEKKESEDVQTAMVALLKGMEERMGGQLKDLSQKLETVAAEHAAQKKVLDAVVQKADTLTTTLKTTVTAVPPSEDRPAEMPRMRVQKDEDPRTGNFDTAFLRRRR